MIFDVAPLIPDNVLIIIVILFAVSVFAVIALLAVFHFKKSNKVKNEAEDEASVNSTDEVSK